MRRSLPLNTLLVTIAAAAALVLTVVRDTPGGLLNLETREVRAGPGDPAIIKHDLTALKIFNSTLLRIKERYVDPTRIDPRKMLYKALDSVQFNIPEVLVEPDEANNQVAVRVNDKREVFDASDVDSLWRLAAKLKKVFRFIESNMNAGADLAQIEYAAVNGMLNTLDPHSVLMDPEAARDMDVSTSGKFGGLGIVIRMIERKLTVIRPIKDTPAWRAGILANDHIVKINQDPTENLTSDEAVDRMRGEPKTSVTLWISRKGETTLRRFDITRDIIRVSSVESKLLDKKVGLIKVKSFSSSTSAEVADAMSTLRSQGATAWVLDLRWNPGGLLEQAVQVSDLFVDSGAVVTTVESRRRKVHDASRGDGDGSSSLAVLVNMGSASASEIVAGALKNLDRAIIIGTRTFGKGSVQELYDNDDGSKLKLTVAQYLTPGDRSIQSVGIVPDILLQRMIIPDKNDAPGDFVRLLAPSRAYGEKELDAHLTSTYAKDADKPVYELSFVVDKPKKPAPAAGTTPTPTPAPAPGTGTPGTDDTEPGPDEQPLDDDVIVEDFETKLARDLVASAPSSNRDRLVKQARKLVDKLRADEEAKLVAALSKIGVDWTAPAAGQTDAARLNARLDTAPAGAAKAGDTITVTGSVRNEGTGPAWRVHARIQADDYVFEDTELPFGKIMPGETKTFVTKVKLPKDAVDRLDRLTVEVREARNAPVVVTPATLRVEAAKRPVFAYAYQLIDEGNGDGLIQKKETYRLIVTVKNTGAGTAAEATALLRNASGDGVALDKSRFELGELKPGDTRVVEFPFAVTPKLKGGEMVVEVLMYDGVLGAQATEKLRFAVRPSVSVVEARGTVEVKGSKHVDIRSGAATDSPLVGTAAGKARFAAVATVGPFTKVDLGGKRFGYIASSSLSKNSSAPTAAWQPVWHSTPPALALANKALDTTASQYRLEGRVTDDTHVEDVYVYVSNHSAKIDGRKVFYRSNRSGKNGKQLDFATDIPLWPGSNQVTVVARENAEVKTIQTVFIYREVPRTAAAPSR
jgi:carboxyl-terminal processing protease